MNPKPSESVRYLYEDGNIPTTKEGNLKKAYTDKEKQDEVDILRRLFTDTLATLKQVPQKTADVKKGISEILDTEAESIFDLIRKLEAAQQDLDRAVSAQSDQKDGLLVLQERITGKQSLQSFIEENLQDIQRSEALRNALSDAVAKIEKETAKNQKIRQVIGGDPNNPAVQIIDINIKQEAATRGLLQTALDSIKPDGNDQLQAKKESLASTLSRINEEISQLHAAIQVQSEAEDRQQKITEKIQSLQLLLVQLNEQLDALRSLLQLVIPVREQIERLEAGVEKVARPYKVLVLADSVFEELAKEVNGLYQELCDAVISVYKKSFQKMYKSYLAVANVDASTEKLEDMEANNAELMKVIPHLKDRLFPHEDLLKKKKERVISAGELRTNEQQAINRLFFPDSGSETSLPDESHEHILTKIKSDLLPNLKDAFGADIDDDISFVLNVVIMELQSNHVPPAPTSEEESMRETLEKKEIRIIKETEKRAKDILQSAHGKFKTFLLSKAHPQNIVDDRVAVVGGKDSSLEIRQEQEKIENALVDSVLMPLLASLTTTTQQEVLKRFMESPELRKVKIVFIGKKGSREYVISRHASEKQGFLINEELPSAQLLKGDQNLFVFLSSVLESLQDGPSVQRQWDLQVSEITS